MSKLNPKVYYCASILGVCYYPRCLIPMREMGADGDKTGLRRHPIPPELKARAVLDADIVVFHRPNDERSLEAAGKLREAGKKIILDNDDTYHQLNDDQINELGLKKVSKALDEFAKQADMVTCSTEYLAEEYRQLNDNVVVLPNCVSLDDWPSEDEILRNEGYKVRVGIVGSATIANDYANFKEVLKELTSRPDVQVVMFGLPPKTAPAKEQSYYLNEYAFWESLPNIEWQPFVDIADYADTLNGLKLDLMVIPRRDEYFNRCKSNIKFLEASCLHIPCIAQGFNDKMSPYEVDPEDAEHMVIVTDNKKWMEALEPLIANKELRRYMGDKAHDYVIRKYSIENNIWRWKQAYKSLLDAQ